MNGVVAEIGAENDILVRRRQDAKSCPAAAQKFLAAIADGRARDGRAGVGVINRAINVAIRPISDMAQWRVPDRWSVPLATLASGRGDCEDYAIAKYVALRERALPKTMCGSSSFAILPTARITPSSPRASTKGGSCSTIVA